MRTTRSKIFFFLSGFALATGMSGCVQFKTQICTDGTNGTKDLRADIPDFEGSYEFFNFNGNTLRVERVPIQMVHGDGKGVYRGAQDGVDSLVCLIDGHYVMETPQQDGTFTLWGIEPRPDGFNMYPFAVDTVVLQNNHISFQVLHSKTSPPYSPLGEVALDGPTPSPVPSPSPSNPSVGADVPILVDNRGIDSQRMFQLIDEEGLRIALRRVSRDSAAQFQGKRSKTSW